MNMPQLFMAIKKEKLWKEKLLTTKEKFSRSETENS
jgi:hypothetical protein